MHHAKVRHDVNFLYSFLIYLFFSLQVVSGFEVTRRILVDLEGISLRRKWLAGLEPENVHMMIGKVTSGKLN